MGHLTQVVAALSCLLVVAAAPAAGGPPVATVPKQNLDNLVDPNADPASAAAASLPPIVDLHLMDEGHKTFRSFCERCHGIDMVSPGGGFFDLRTFPINDKPRFVESVTHGKRAMPAWGAVLKPKDIEALWSYVAGSQMAARTAQ